MTTSTVTGAVSSLLGSSTSGSSGLGYSGENSSSIFTPVSTGITTGGIGNQTFNFGGNPNVQTALQSVASNPWPWALAAAAVAFLMLKGRKL